MHNQADSYAFPKSRILNKPELTIGISFYNTAATLTDVVKSVFAQTFTNWELILVDDGSTDGGYEVVKGINDPRVRVIRDEINRGRPFRYNYITRIARGDFIARFDADDLCDPEKFEKQINFLKAHPNVDVVSTGALSIGSGDVPLGIQYANAITHEEICCNPLSKFGLIHGSMMGRKKWFERYLYPERYRNMCEDYALFISSWEKSRFANIAEPLYFYKEYETYSLRKYYHSQVSVARAIWEYGRTKYGTLISIKAVLSRFLRIVVYVFCVAVHLENWFVSHHSSSLNSLDKRRFAQTLSIIRGTKVPGINKVTS